MSDCTLGDIGEDLDEICSPIIAREKKQFENPLRMIFMVCQDNPTDPLRGRNQIRYRKSGMLDGNWEE